MCKTVCKRLNTSDLTKTMKTCVICYSVAEWTTHTSCDVEHETSFPSRQSCSRQQWERTFQTSNDHQVCARAMILLIRSDVCTHPAPLRELKTSTLPVVYATSDDLHTAGHVSDNRDSVSSYLCQWFSSWLFPCASKLSLLYSMGLCAVWFSMISLV